MRFAVHRPGNPVASPRSHGVPRRDVDGRVHVRVAGETAGSAHEPRLALPRVRIHLPARRAPLARERGSDLLHPAGRLVLQPADQQPPPRPRIPRFSPALARTFRPGFSRVPLADRVMFPIFRSSTRITSNRRAMSVETFSAQSLRRSVSRARSRAIACFTRPRRFDPRLARASVRCSRRSLRPLPPGQAGSVQQVPGGQGRGDRHAPVNAHHLAVTRRGNRLRDGGEGDMPPARPVPGHPVGLHPRRHGAGPAEPHPPGLGHPDLADVAGYAAHVPLPPAPPGDPESLIPPGLAPRRPPGRVARVEERRHRLGEVAQRLLLHRLGAGGQPRVLGSRLR